jgi:hypothetical protein
MLVMGCAAASRQGDVQVGPPDLAKEDAVIQALLRSAPWQTRTRIRAIEIDSVVRVAPHEMPVPLADMTTLRVLSSADLRNWGLDSRGVVISKTSTRVQHAKRLYVSISDVANWRGRPDSRMLLLQVRSPGFEPTADVTFSDYMLVQLVFTGRSWRVESAEWLQP